MIITYDEPGILYDDPRVTYDGVFTDASVWPAESTVSLGVQYGPNGVDFTGSAIAGNGAQIIAYRSDVQVSTPMLRISSQPKRSEVRKQKPNLTVKTKSQRSRHASTYTMTSEARVDVVTAKETVSVTTTVATAQV